MATFQHPSSSRNARGLVSVALILAFSAVAAGPVVGQEAPTPQIKIAVVDIDRVVIQSTAGQALQERLKNLEQQTQAKLAEKAQKIQTLRDSLAGKTPDESRELQKQIEDETLSGRRMREDAQREAEKMQQTELEVIRQSLRPVFEKIQSESSYDLILNYNPAVVIAAGPSVDITDRVLEVLNSGG